MKPTLSTRPSSSARSSPANVVRARRPGRRSARRRARRRRGTARASASPSAGAYSAGFHTTALPHSSAGTRYQAGTATGKLPAVMIAATPTGIAEGEELLVGHLARHGLAVEPPALAEEEVARVDDLLHLAERLGVGLADLARDERAPAPPCWPRRSARSAGSRGRAPAPASPPTRAAPPARRARRPRTSPASPSALGDDLLEIGRIGGGQAAAGSVAARHAVHDGGDGGRAGASGPGSGLGGNGGHGPSTVLAST